MDQTKTYACQCGRIVGSPCDWSGPASEMLVVEWMPWHHRGSHEAAGNAGVYPHNGAERLAVEASCAALLVESGDGWVSVVEAPVDRYLPHPVSTPVSVTVEALVDGTLVEQVVQVPDAAFAYYGVSGAVALARAEYGDREFAPVAVTLPNGERVTQF